MKTTNDLNDIHTSQKHSQIEERHEDILWWQNSDWLSNPGPDNGFCHYEGKEARKSQFEPSFLLLLPYIRLSYN